MQTITIPRLAVTRPIFEDRYPAAEGYAARMPLPLMVEPEAKALYGVTTLVLDRAAAARALDGANLRRNSPAWEAAWAVLEERVANLE